MVMFLELLKVNFFCKLLPIEKSAAEMPKFPALDETMLD
jgi:hypothetical protein